MNYANDHQDQIDGLLLNSPLIELNIKFQGRITIEIY
jgi:hypothetical protein